MKRDPQHPAAGNGADFERQVTALAPRLRDAGLAPARDLWPDIARSLDAVPRHRLGRPERGARWPGAALAACVLLAVGLGLSGIGRGPAVDPAARRADRPPAAAERAPARATVREPVPASDAGRVATRQGLRAVEQALSELQAALARSPDDPDLSRLILMIHHSRGRLLRLQADGGSRNTPGGRT